MNRRQGPPKHQNHFAWVPKSGVKINETEPGGRFRPLSEITGVCPRCREQIDWKRRYGKYKALVEPAKCQQCLKRNVRQAYHNICFGCAKEKDVCAKCRSRVERIVGRDLSEVEADQKMLDEAIKHARERDRRTLLRDANKGKSKSSTNTMTQKKTVGDLFPNASLEDYANKGKSDRGNNARVVDVDGEVNEADDIDHDDDHDEVSDGDNEDASVDHDDDHDENGDGEKEDNCDNSNDQEDSDQDRDDSKDGCGNKD